MARDLMPLPATADHIAPAQAQAIIAHLPSASAVTQRFAALRATLKREGTDLHGIGDHGEIHDYIHEVPPSQIWVDPSLYIRRAIDDELDAAIAEDGELLQSYLAGAKRDTLYNAQTGVADQYTFEPILCIRRPQSADPDDPQLLLLKGYATWRVACQRTPHPRFVETIIIPDMPDYHLRDIGLRLALGESAPPIWEVARTLLCMEQDYRAGQRAATAELDQPPPSVADWRGILRCTKGYVSKLQTIFNNPVALDLVASHRLSLRTAYTIITKLGSYPETCAALLTAAATDAWTATIAEEQATQALDAYRQARQPPAIAQFAKYVRKVNGLTILNAQDLASTFGAHYQEVQAALTVLVTQLQAIGH